ncbi:MAG: sialidase family protein [Kiritimatiellia bacterium]
MRKTLLSLITVAMASLLCATPELLDLSRKTENQMIIAQGAATLYNGHPTLVSTTSGKLIAVWTYGHGGAMGPMAESTDHGKTWKRTDEKLPAEAKTYINCPSIYELTDPQTGKKRLWIFAQYAKTSQGPDWMARVMSEDDGETWKVMPALGKGFHCVMTFASIVQLKDGRYLGVYHGGPAGADRPPLKVYSSISSDGGMTWGQPALIAEEAERNLCEPFVFRSPTTPNELCCLLRENTHKDVSRMMFSTDEGKTWTRPQPAAHVVTGDRHVGITLLDGKLAIAFRDVDKTSPYCGHFVLWVGTYDDFKNTRENGKRIRLLESHAAWDCGYPGMALLPDGSLLCLTYIKYRPGKERHSIIAMRVPANILSPVSSK